MIHKISDKGSPEQDIIQKQSNTRYQTKTIQHKIPDKGSPTQDVRQGQSNTDYQTRAVQLKMSDKGSPTQTIRQGQSNTRCQTRAVQHKMSDKGSPTQISDKGSPTQDVRQGQSNTRCQTKVVQHRRQTAVPKDGEVMGGWRGEGGGDAWAADFQSRLKRRRGKVAGPPKSFTLTTGAPRPLCQTGAPSRAFTVSCGLQQGSYATAHPPSRLCRSLYGST